MPAVLLRVPGLDPFDLNPKRSHHTDSLLRPYRACADANGTPLSVRMARGRPNSLKVRSKTVNANFSWVVESASHVRR